MYVLKRYRITLKKNSKWRPLFTATFPQISNVTSRRGAQKSFRGIQDYLQSCHTSVNYDFIQLLCSIVCLNRRCHSVGQNIGSMFLKDLYSQNRHQEIFRIISLRPEHYCLFCFKWNSQFYKQAPMGVLGGPHGVFIFVQNLQDSQYSPLVDNLNMGCNIRHTYWMIFPRSAGKCQSNL